MHSWPPRLAGLWCQPTELPAIIRLHIANAIVQTRFVQGLTFTPEVDAGNAAAAAAALVAQGVKTIVVLIHAGGRPVTEDVNSCDSRHRHRSVGRVFRKQLADSPRPARPYHSKVISSRLR